MKKYGLKIGNVGVEFVSIDERDKAIKDFTKGTNVIIRDDGVRFNEGNCSFGVYDRDTKEVLVNCAECKGIFGIDSCGQREYPAKCNWQNAYEIRTNYICDACYARKLKEKEIFDAKQLLNKAERGDE
jgi:hypothetical protein